MKPDELQVEFRDGVFVVERLGEVLRLRPFQKARAEHHRFLIRQFGSLMRQVRELKGLRQDVAAEVIGISPRCLSQLENGRNHEWVTFLRLMEAYGLDGAQIHELLGCLLVLYLEHFRRA